MTKIKGNDIKNDNTNFSTGAETFMSVFKKRLIKNILNVLIEIWEKSKSDFNSNKRHYMSKKISLLMVFQEKLKNIKNWSEEIVTEKFNTIREKSGNYNWENLVTVAFVNQTRLISHMLVGKQTKAIELKIPSPKNFIHKVLIEAGNNICEIPYLFEDRKEKIRSYDIQKNLESVKKIIEAAIEDTVNQNIPIDEIIDSYTQEPDDSDESKSEKSETKSNITISNKNNLTNLAKSTNSDSTSTTITTTTTATASERPSSPRPSLRSTQLQARQSIQEQLKRRLSNNSSSPIPSISSRPRMPSSGAPSPIPSIRTRCKTYLESESERSVSKSSTGRGSSESPEEYKARKMKEIEHLKKKKEEYSKMLEEESKKLERISNSGSSVSGHDKISRMAPSPIQRVSPARESPSESRSENSSNRRVSISPNHLGKSNGSEGSRTYPRPILKRRNSLSSNSSVEVGEEEEKKKENETEREKDPSVKERRLPMFLDSDTD